MKFYQISAKETENILKTNIKSGLSDTQAKERLKKYGPNSIEIKKATPLIKIFFSQFLNPLMFILIIAAIASLLLKEGKDAIVIAIAAIINVTVGFIQEARAEKAAKKLRLYEAHFCNVRRNNKIIHINSKELVPGDIVLISAGDKITADIRLTYTVDFKVEEAILTGESKPIEKNTTTIRDKKIIGDQTNMTFAGTHALSGKAEGIVAATGFKTHLGQISRLVSETKEKSTPLQNKIKKFSWWLGAILLSIVTIIAILGFIKGISFYQVITMAIALAVAAIPEGLVVTVTAVLAIGMQRMLKRKAIVRHLIAAETLGSISVICTDKTGTITQGFMSVDSIITASQEIKSYDIDKIIKLIQNNKEIIDVLISLTLNNDAQLPNGAKTITGNSTEVAILKSIKSAGINIKQIREKFKRINEIPFSSEIKYMATLHKINNENKLIVKGAPEKIFQFCTQNNELERFKNHAEKMSTQGLRILALAEKQIDGTGIKNNLNNLKCTAVIGIQDPLRPTTVETIKKLKSAGIKLVLVTGDHKNTAINIAKQAGLPVREKNVITGNELDNLSKKQLENQIEQIDIFARIEPAHKIRIVHAWEKAGQSVAMIGDGVNDAPALKAADIGVALGSGSDVAHETSDIVLLDNNLSTIAAAVKEGRTIFDNIRKIIVYLMADSFGEIVLIGVSILLGLPLPLLATQILWINLVTDGFPAIALTVEKGEPEIMNEKPKPQDEPIMNTEMKVLIFIIGIITDLGLFAIYFTMLKMNLDIHHIRTMIFSALTINSLLYIFSVKSFRKTIFQIDLFANKWMLIAVSAGLITQLLALYLPSLQKLFQVTTLNIYDWGIIVGLASIKITAIEITKKWFLIKDNKNTS